MKHLISILFLLCLHTTVFGQQKEVDSLKHLLLNTNQDTLRVSRLLNLSYAINNISSDSALVYVDEALQLSKDLKWTKGIALSYRQKGLVFYYKSDYFNALEFSQKALEYKIDGDNKLFESSVYSNIGNIYADVKEYDKALLNYNKLLKVSQEKNVLKDELIATYNIATVFTEQGKYQEAINMYIKSKALAEENDLDIYIPNICNNLSKTYGYISEIEKAVKYLNIGIEKAQAQNNIYTLALLKRNLAEIYFKKTNLSQAETLLKESISLSKANNTIEWEAQSLKLLYQVYEKQEKFQKAFTAHKKYKILQDSIINNDTKAEFIKRDLTFENEKQQSLAKAEIERQKLIKNGSIFGGSLILVCTIFGLIAYKRKREAEFKTTVANTELKALRAQMNPHFIFNSLNSISSYIDNNDRKEAKEYLAKFASIMRKTLENSEQKEILLADDIALLKLYMDVEQKRLQGKFDYSIDIDEQIDPANTLVPPLILQPFIENSIWHGLSQKKEKGTICIDVKRKGNSIIYSVEDNGVGLSIKKKNTNKKSFGMEITKNRVDIINHQKNSNGSVTIIEKEVGIRVEVQIPLELAF